MDPQMKQSEDSGSSQYQVLGPEESEPCLIDHQYLHYQPKSANNSHNNDHQIKMGVIVDESTYVVLEAHEKCNHTEDEWQKLLLKKKKQAEASYKSDILVHSSLTSRLSFCQRNDILNILFQDQRRVELWTIANFNQTLEEKYIQIEQYEVTNAEERKQELLHQLPQEQIKALKTGVSKITQIFKKIITYYTTEDSSNLNKEWISHLTVLKDNQTPILSWIYRILQRCALQFKEIRYCKGLEYLCLGIVISYPEINFAKYTQLFDYFLKINQFYSFYLEGSPKYYSQLNKIVISLREQHPLLNQLIEKYEGNLQNLFVSYFRSFLLYRITNPEIIRKIFELLFIEGISIIKTIILRVLSQLTPFLLKSDHPLETIASFLISEYFKDCEKQNQKVVGSFKRLFQI